LWNSNIYFSAKQYNKTEVLPEDSGRSSVLLYVMMSYGSIESSHMQQASFSAFLRFAIPSLSGIT
jgi:hypothetical protein